MSRRVTTQLRGRLFPLFGRVVAWLIVTLYVAGMFTTAWLERRLGLQNGDPVEDMILAVGFGAFAIVGALLVARRPTNLVGWIMAVVALMVSLFPIGDAYAAYVMVTRGHPDALAVVGAWVQSWYWLLLLALVFVYLPLLFPDGRLPSRRWLPVAVLPGVGALGVVVLGALTDTLTGQNVDYRIENPIGIEGLAYVEDLPVFAVMGGLFAFGAVGAVASVVVRFRRSRGIERQQIKWFVYPVALTPIVSVGDYLPGIIGEVAFGVVLIGLPTAIGIAILRHRLYDIDLIVNRTLVYGVLTATLALVYVGSVISLQSVLRTLSGQDSQLAVVASTLVIAALFNPLRRRVQAFVDRRFYRRKYDAAKTLAAFNSRLRDETDLDALTGDVVGVVRETLQPAHVSLWLRPDPGSKGDGAPG